MAYDHRHIEAKWQNYWEKNALFKAEPFEAGKPKYYILDMFPYPSSSGLHVGHPEGYTATDILARYKRARGFNVLHPMGWDAFGLPAEQYALQTGIHPAITTQKAIETFRRQLKQLGLSYDWSREIATCDSSFYKWTQFLFLKLYEKGLAYQKEVPVNWCPELKTVLANEEVIDGRSERGGHPVYRVPMKQWMLKITQYADRLLADLDGLDWPESTKELQRNWIGRSEGLQLQFCVDGIDGDKIEIFTTRGDTFFGVTYLVLAPEHPLIQKITTEGQRAAVEAYRTQASQRSELLRQDAAQEKTGVFTGSYAIHPGTNKKIPIWIADYVLMAYGTGAVQAVPSHDERDAALAKKYQLPFQVVVEPIGQDAGHSSERPVFTGEGRMIQSDFLNGLSTQEARQAMIVWAEKHGCGRGVVQYKLRDWLFSRQRYWGEPLPMVYLPSGEVKPVDLDELPIVLPAVESYEPSGTGKSPLEAIHDWVHTHDVRTGEPLRRETDTMPGSAGSSWYFFRYCDPTNQNEPFSVEADRFWMPVDLYLGGPEHAVGHLLYARFWTKVLFDAGLTVHSEPFKKLVHQGMILGEDGEKMSKSRGNTINPDVIIEKYGADALRVYEMFMGPLERDKPWSMTAIEGVYRFFQRIWRLFQEDGVAGIKVTADQLPSSEDLRMTHKTIKKITEDIENLRFNTAISQMMIFVNHMTQLKSPPRACIVPFVQLLQPFAPHLAEELWEMLGEGTVLSRAPWPNYDENLARDQHITIAVQVMGKTRGTLEVSPELGQAEIEDLAQKIHAVANQLQGKQIKKIIFVKGKIVNFICA